jgi:hypothetical protein
LILLALAAAATFSLTSRGDPVPAKADEVASATGTMTAKALAPSPPVRLRIPAIGVNSAVHRLGLTTDGRLDVPTGSRYDEAGWYGGSPAPGSLGPAVIVGHVDSAKDGPSVFFRLRELRVRDVIEVTRVDGPSVRFVVESVASYRKSAFPTALVYGDTDHSALRLITCGGVFDREAGSYTENVVVLARLITGSPTRAALGAARVTSNRS